MVPHAEHFPANPLSAWIPSVSVWTAAIAGFSIVAFLFLFSRAPFKLRLTLPRYSAATAAGLLVWTILLWWKRCLPLRGTDDGLDLIAGGLLFVTAIFCSYYLGNISAGFRIEMLINLADLKREVTLQAWMAQYGAGRGMHYFLEDRLRATLLPWNLVSWKDDKLALTRSGQWIAQINRFVAALLSEDNSLQ